MAEDEVGCWGPVPQQRGVLPPTGSRGPNEGPSWSGSPFVSDPGAAPNSLHWGLLSQVSNKSKLSQPSSCIMSLHCGGISVFLFVEPPLLPISTKVMV